MFKGVKNYLSRLIVRLISKETSSYRAYQFLPIADLETCLQPGDILLIEGNQYVSTAIKYLTQSTWSHAAMYIGRTYGVRDQYGHMATLIEADVKEGVIASSLTKYLGFNTRICRPALINMADREAVIDYMIDSLGKEYDVTNVTDLARYLMPQPPVPTRFRRRMIALGSGDPSRAICSTLIAQAFQSVRYPILPTISYQNNREISHIRHHSLFTPRDFDLSPYFQVIKPIIENPIDYKKLTWQEPNEVKPLKIAK